MKHTTVKSSFAPTLGIGPSFRDSGKTRWFFIGLLLVLTACLSCFLIDGHKLSRELPYDIAQGSCAMSKGLLPAHFSAEPEPSPDENERTPHTYVRLLSEPKLLVDFLESVSVASLSDCENFERWVGHIIASRDPAHANILCDGVLMTTPFLLTKSSLSTRNVSGEDKTMSMFSFVNNPRDEAERDYDGRQILVGNHSVVARVVGSSPQWFADGSPDIRFPQAMTNDRAHEIIQSFIANEISANDLLLDEVAAHIFHSDRFAESLRTLDYSTLSVGISALAELGDVSFLERFGPQLYSGHPELEIESWRALASLYYIWTLSWVASCGEDDEKLFADHTLIASFCGFTLFVSGSRECYPVPASDGSNPRTKSQFVGCLLPSFQHADHPTIGFTLIVYESQEPFTPPPGFDSFDIFEEYIPVIDAFANYLVMLWGQEMLWEQE